MAAPDRQSLALALLAVAAADDGPPRVALEYSPARLHLVVEVREASEPREPAADLDERSELPGVDVLSVAGDVPPARENEPRVGPGVLEHRLRRAGGVVVHAAG